MLKRVILVKALVVRLVVSVPVIVVHVLRKCLFCRWGDARVPAWRATRAAAVRARAPDLPAGYWDRGLRARVAPVRAAPRSDDPHWDVARMPGMLQPKPVLG